MLLSISSGNALNRVCLDGAKSAVLFSNGLWLLRFVEAALTILLYQDGEQCPKVLSGNGGKCVSV